MNVEVFGDMPRIYAGYYNWKTACGLRRLTVNLTAVILEKYGMIFCLFIVSWPSDRNLVRHLHSLSFQLRY